ncbi:Hypothetical predicted protein [Pelobates cultripes]|uniref:Uncharacterized protein n=1 Tax=Pelobates cultripes TaxID=61616 RepID=A0AAD1W0M1_PELCU|nr:Hypothetical predicted protein [Pelobates cultripes]
MTCILVVCFIFAGWVKSKPPKRIQFLKDYMKQADREPIIGSEYVTEYRVQTKPDKFETKYKCEICDLETDLLPLIEHLTGFRHRRLYVAKEYPYVLKAQFPSKDRAQFLKRMALEIEREEGTKMYKIDPATKLESLLTLQIPEKEAEKKSRWDVVEKNREQRIKKALEYLENFDIESESESTIVTNLTQKLTAALKEYNTVTKEKALFPVKLAKAKDVALAIMQHSANVKNVPKPVSASVPKPVSASVPKPVSASVPKPVSASVPKPVSASVPKPFPTSVPTSFPTSVPTSFPTSVPTSFPTSVPTSFPTSVQTSFPTSVQTSFPTSVQTSFPTSVQTSFPTSVQTSFPTSVPTSVQASYPASYPASYTASYPASYPASYSAAFPASYPTAVPTAVSTSVQTPFLPSFPPPFPPPFLPPFPPPFPTTVPTPAPHKQNTPVAKQNNPFVRPQLNVKPAETTVANKNLGILGPAPGSLFHPIGTQPGGNQTSPSFVTNSNSYVQPVQNVNNHESFLSNATEITANLPQPGSVPDNQLSSEDLTFFKKLKTLLEVLPNEKQNTRNNQMDSKLFMLKELLLDKPPSMDNTQLNHQLMTQISSLSHDSTSTDNNQLRQQLMMLLATNEIDPNLNNQQDFTHTNDSYEDFQYAAPSEDTFNNINYQQPLDVSCNTVSVDIASDIEPYKSQEIVTEVYSYDSTLDNRNDLSYSEPSVTKQDYSPNPHDQYIDEPRSGTYTRVSLSPTILVPSHLHDDYRQQDLSYRRREVSARDILYEERMPGYRSSRDLLDESDLSRIPYSERRRERRLPEIRHNSEEYHLRPSHFSERYLSDPEFHESEFRGRRVLERDYFHSSKRPRLDDIGMSPLDLNREGLSAEILRRIRGRDLFTASAILSEYAEKR